MAGKIALGAAVFLVWASFASGEPPAKPERPRKTSASAAGSVHRLDEVRITGSAEHPGVLFFLPRAKARLLPVRERHGGRERLLRDYGDMEAGP